MLTFGLDDVKVFSNINDSMILWNVLEDGGAVVFPFISPSYVSQSIIIPEGFPEA